MSPSICYTITLKSYIIHTLAMEKLFYVFVNWQNNIPPNPPKADLAGKVENIGVEPTTSCMPCKRSSQLS